MQIEFERISLSSNFYFVAHVCVWVRVISMSTQHEFPIWFQNAISEIFGLPNFHWQKKKEKRSNKTRHRFLTSMTQNKTRIQWNDSRTMCVFFSSIVICELANWSQLSSQDDRNRVVELCNLQMRFVIVYIYLFECVQQQIAKQIIQISKLSRKQLNID